MSALTVTVPVKALHQVLSALNGPPHHIRELQVTRGLPGDYNPIDELCEAYNKWVDEYNASLAQPSVQEQTPSEPA